MIEPLANLLLVTELTEEEKKDLGFPPGVGEGLDVGVVVTVGPDVEQNFTTGDKVFFSCRAPKCGPESMLVHSDCVLAVDRG